jgi:hypothetical protein
MTTMMTMMTTTDGLQAPGFLGVLGVTLLGVLPGLS